MCIARLFLFQAKRRHLLTATVAVSLKYLKCHDAAIRDRSQDVTDAAMRYIRRGINKGAFSDVYDKLHLVGAFAYLSHSQAGEFYEETSSDARNVTSRSTDGVRHLLIWAFSPADKLHQFTN